MNVQSKLCPAKLVECAALALKLGCSDIHLSVDKPTFFRVAGEIKTVDKAGSDNSMSSESWSANEMDLVIDWLVGEPGWVTLKQRGSIDGAVVLDQVGTRFRYNIFQTQSKFSIALRLLDDKFRSLAELGLNERLYDLCDQKDGLVLVAGPTGSGKSTTLAAMIDRINSDRSAHIITIEDPIEYLHSSKKSLVSQRQINLDTPSFNQALVDALRQDPDVILVGELRELQTIRTAIEAAETGHLVFATVHAGDAIGALERLVSVFPGDEQALMHQMLSTSLQAVIVQHLLPIHRSSAEKSAESRVLASEVLLGNSAVANLISGNNLTQIRSVMETSSATGMYTLDSCLARLYRERKIEQQVALTLARNPKMLMELARAI